MSLAPNMACGRVTITTTATQIVAARNGRRKILLRGSPAVLIGGDSSVTTSSGFQLLGQLQETGTFPDQVLELETESAVYGIVASSTATIQFVELY